MDHGLPYTLASHNGQYSGYTLPYTSENETRYPTSHNHSRINEIEGLAKWTDTHQPKDLNVSRKMSHGTEESNIDHRLPYTPESHTSQYSGYAMPYISTEESKCQTREDHPRHHARPQDKANPDSHHYGGEPAERPTPLYPELMSISRQSRPQRPARPNRLSQLVSSSQARLKVFRGFVGERTHTR